MPDTRLASSAAAPGPTLPDAAFTTAASFRNLGRSAGAGQ